MISHLRMAAIAFVARSAKKQENEEEKKQDEIITLTTIATHSKVFSHLYSFGIRIENKIPSQRKPFTMATKNRFDSLAFHQWSSDPT